ncbi:MAG: hypothetical protein JW889_15805 [Verrucomicrobia bacterium]|nr:hypothetical protein [Verrucomicrobiota bacterium]
MTAQTPRPSNQGFLGVLTAGIRRAFATTGLAAALTILTLVSAAAPASEGADATGANDKAPPRGLKIAPGLSLIGYGQSRTRPFELASTSLTDESLSEVLERIDYEADMRSAGLGLSYEILPRFEIAAYIAGIDVEFEGTSDAGAFFVDTKLRPFYGVGARYACPDDWLPGFDLDLNFEYLLGSFDDPDYTISGTDGPADAAITQLDWEQVAFWPRLSKRVGIFTPYVKLTFTWIDADIEGRRGRISLENGDVVGLILGTRFTVFSWLDGDVFVDALNYEGIHFGFVVQF